MLLFCAGTFPFPKTIVQIALSLHKIALNSVQMIMNEALGGSPTAPRLVRFLN